MTTYEALYEGADSYLMPPSYKSTGHQMDASELGMSLDPRTGNQLGELNLKMNPGIKNIEIQGTSAGEWESVPEQHLDEMRRLTELGGVKPSLHAPIVEPSGVGEKGWQEENRLAAEQQLQSAVLRGHKLDPKGNISITAHTTGQLPEMRSYIKDKDGKQKLQSIWVINPGTGKVSPIEPEKRYFPEQGKFTGKPEEFNPETELKKLNNDQWTDQLSGINRYADYGEESINRIKSQVKDDEILSMIAKGNIDEIKDEEDKKKFKSFQRELNHGQLYLRDAYKNMKSLFDKVYINAEGEDKTRLKNFAEEIAPVIKEGIENNPESINKLGEVVEKGLRVLGNLKETPQMWKPLDKFVIEKSAETFANIAETAYNKFGDTTPMINLENPPAGSGLSRGEDVKNLVEETRKKLAENLRKNGTSGADKIAEKIIGATWDVGHINMLRKKGYSEKDIIKETEKVAPFVKHVHLSDNFGLNHTELPMGMGNVPLKQIMEKLGEKGFEGKKIIEAGNWWQHFAEHGGGNPFKPTLEALDSPIYSMKTGPVWSQSGAIGSYYSGHGPVNTPIHHKLYGAGFEALPQELGGQIPGEQSRFSGTPNQ